MSLFLLQAGAGPPGTMVTNCSAAAVEDSQVRQMPEQHDVCSGDKAHSLLPANAEVVLPSVLTKRWMYLSRKVLGFNAGCVAGCCDQRWAVIDAVDKAVKLAKSPSQKQLLREGHQTNTINIQILRNQQQFHILSPIQVYMLKTEVANSLRMGPAEVLWDFQTPVC